MNTAFMPPSYLASLGKKTQNFCAAFPMDALNNQEKQRRGFSSESRFNFKTI